MQKKKGNTKKKKRVVGISELNTKIEELTIANEERQKTIESLKIDLNEVKKEKNKLEQYISLEDPDDVEYSDEHITKFDEEYKAFLQTEVSTYFEQMGMEISQFKSIPKHVDAIIIEKLIYNGLIRKIDDLENKRVYYLLTKKGKYFWKNYVLSKRILTRQELESNDELPF